jgi:FkbM family methyltransferase
MIILLKTIFKKLLPNILIEYIKLYTFYKNDSYSQEGEDLIIDRILNSTKKGFYIDIGAHHPFRFSNTYKFYKKGWNGINIDAMPGSMRIFRQVRPRDINVECGISKNEEILKYYIFNDKALNTFSITEAQSKNNHENYKIIKILEIETKPLSKILETYLKPNTKIDFLTIDVEGLDIEVLESFDLDKYKIPYILIEDLLSELDEIFISSPTYRFLEKHKTKNTVIYKLKD